MINPTYPVALVKAFRVLTAMFFLLTIFSGLPISGIQTRASQDDVVELDPQLRKVILILLDQNSNSTDPITVGELQSITRTLRIEGGKVQSLEGLQYATSLTTIQIISSALSDITPIINLSKLKQLFISAPIEKLPSLKSLTELESFTINNSLLTDISSIGELPSDTHIEITGSSLKVLPNPSAIKNVRYLNLTNNRIDDVSNLVGLTNLEQLDLSSNRISDISMITDLPNLKSLNLSYNVITDFSPLSELPKLEVLKVRSNSISSISNVPFDNLVDLDISCNNLIEMDFMQYFPNLENLSADYNKIHDISAITSNASIRFIGLSNNDIVDVSPLSDYHGTNLEFLGLTNNKIVDIACLQGVENKYKLYLYGNNIDLNDPLNYNFVRSWGDSFLFDAQIERKSFESMELVSSIGVKDITKELNWYQIDVPINEQSIRFNAVLSDSLDMSDFLKINNSYFEESMNLTEDSISFDIDLDPEIINEIFTYKVETYRTNDGLEYLNNYFVDYEYITIVVTKINSSSMHTSQSEVVSDQENNGLSNINAFLTALLVFVFLLIGIVLLVAYIKRNRKI